SRKVLRLAGHGARNPVFCIPAASDDPYYLRHLAARLDGRPFYAVSLPPPALSESWTVEGIARDVLNEIHSVYPQGSYILAGHCFGGVVAFEAARQVHSANQHMPLLLLLDAPTPGYPKALPRWRRYPPAAWNLLRRDGPAALA